jgi:hypothetical protein
MTGLQRAALQRSAFIDAIQNHDPDNIAVVHSLSGRSFKYGSLLGDIAQRKAQILADTGKNEQTVAGERIAFLVENSYDYVGAPPRIPLLPWITRLLNTFQSLSFPVSHPTP